MKTNDRQAQTCLINAKYPSCTSMDFGTNNKTGSASRTGSTEWGASDLASDHDRNLSTLNSPSLTHCTHTQAEIFIDTFTSPNAA